MSKMSKARKVSDDDNDYEDGYSDGYDDGYSKALEDWQEVSVSYSAGLYTASLTDNPSVFETETSMFEALGRLVFRVGNVSKVGVLP